MTDFDNVYVQAARAPSSRASASGRSSRARARHRRPFQAALDARLSSSASACQQLHAPTKFNLDNFFNGVLASAFLASGDRGHELGARDQALGASGTRRCGRHVSVDQRDRLTFAPG